MDWQSDLATRMADRLIELIEEETRKRKGNVTDPDYLEFIGPNNIWRTRFDKERQLPEIDFNILYADQFHHGTVGHNERLVMAKMAKLLDSYQAEVNRLIAEKREFLKSQG